MKMRALVFFATFYPCIIHRIFILLGCLKISTLFFKMLIGFIFIGYNHNVESVYNCELMLINVIIGRIKTDKK